MMTFKQWLVYSYQNPTPASNQNPVTNVFDTIPAPPIKANS